MNAPITDITGAGRTRWGAQRPKSVSPSPPQPVRPRRDDQEFLPADLEILETPPSPVRMALILLIGSLAIITLIWSWVGHIEIISTAQGKIQPTGRVKVVQPVETGKVAAILVENGRAVHAGDLLIEMESGDAQAEVTTAADALAAAKAEVARRKAALTAATAQMLPDKVDVPWTTDIPEANQFREQQVLNGDLRKLVSGVAGIDAQIHQKEIERDRLQETMQSEQALLDTLKERVDMRTALVTQSAGSRASLIDSIETMQTQKTVLTTQRSQHDAAIANLLVLARDRDNTISTFIAENGQKLADAQRQADDYQQRLAKARLHLDHTRLVSPIDGTVLGLSVSTVGQVLTSGEEVMRVVPDDGATLEIEGYLANKDIGFVKAGQIAVIKVESFPFTRYGTITAEVTRVGHDAIPQPEAQQTESSGASSQAKPNLFIGAERTQNLVFPITLRLQSRTMNVDGEPIPLRPGMAVHIEIATGSRRIIEFFLSPLVEVTSGAIKER